MIQSKSEKIKVLTQDNKNIYISNPSEEESDSLLNNCPQKKPGENSQKKYIHLKRQSSFEYKIGNYLIEKTLGEGTFGKVKLGTYLINNEKCAIKILEKSRMTDKDDLTRVKREFDMISKFNHPNVILVTEIFENMSSYYSVMEFCEGGELFNYIVQKKRISENEASFFYYQLINGLEYIHSLGIVHRDLKPENILLTKDHLLKIIDFGLSNYFVKGQKLLSTPCGSPCYASPEMVAGKEYDGVKIDIWSTGIILYAMICGFLPFEDKNHDILFEKILQCKVEYPPFLSYEVKDLLKKILVVDPKKRIDIPGIKKHSFFFKGKSFFEQIFSIKQNFYNENNQHTEKEINCKKKENKETTNDLDMNKGKKKILNNKNENKIEIKSENIKENNKQALDKDKIVNITNPQNPDNITGENIKNKKNETNDLRKLKKDKIEQKNNKYNKKTKVDKRKKIDITDNHYDIINSSITKDNKSKITQRISDIKIEKDKPKDLTTDKKEILEIIEKNRIAMNSLESLNPSIEQNYRSLKHQINITNLMVNNINYNVNISFEDSKRTYSHENTKYNIYQSDKPFKSSANSTSPHLKNTHKNTSKNSSNIIIIDNNMSHNSNKTVLGTNYLFKYYNSYNKEIKKGVHNLYKTKEKSKHKRIGGNAFIDSNKFRLFMEKALANKDKKTHISKKFVDNNSNLIDKANNNIMIIENDSKISKSYKKNNLNSNSESNSKTKDSNLYNNKTNYINIYKTIVNNKENKINNEHKNKKFIKISINNNIHSKDNSLRNSQYHIALNSNSKKVLSKKQFNLINKNVINNIKKINKFQFNKLLNLYSMDIETSPNNSQKEKSTKGDVMNIVNTQGTNEKSFNKQLNNKIKYSMNTLRKTNNIYQTTISSDKNLKKRQQLINNFYYNQLTNSSTHKIKYDTINFIHNFRIVKPALFLNKKIQKNISKQTQKPLSYIKKDISNNLTEKGLKSIDKDKESKTKRNDNKIDNKTIDINLTNDRGNTLSNYLKLSDKMKNQNKIIINKSHKSNSKNKSKSKNLYKKDESKNSRKKILIISCESDKDFDQNKIKKMNKFRKICLKKKNDNKNDIKNSQNSMKKSQIKAVKRPFNINTTKHRPYNIRKNKTENNLGLIKYIPLYSIQTHQKNINTFHSYNKNRIKYNNGKLTDIYRNTIKKRNKLKKVYLINTNNNNNRTKDSKNSSNVESSNNVFRNKINE